MHSPDEARLLRVVVQRPPDLADQHVEVAFDDEDIRPDLAKEVGLRHDVRPLARPGRTRRQRPSATGGSPRRRASAAASASRARSRSKRAFTGRLQDLEDPSAFLRTYRRAVQSWCGFYCERHTSPVRPRSDCRRARQHAALSGAADVLGARTQPISGLSPSRRSTRDSRASFRLLREQTIRGLVDEVDKLNRPFDDAAVCRTADSAERRYPSRARRATGTSSSSRTPMATSPEGAFVIDSELRSPQGRSSVRAIARAESRPSISASGSRRASTRSRGRPRPDARVLARLTHDDESGHHAYDVVKDSVTIGRGGADVSGGHQGRLVGGRLAGAREDSSRSADRALLPHRSQLARHHVERPSRAARLRRGRRHEARERCRDAAAGSGAHRSRRDGVSRFRGAG